MAVKIHSIKIAPKYLDAVVAGQKKAELRKNDRAYSVGDVLSLQEWKHGSYTGREWAAVITHMGVYCQRRSAVHASGAGKRDSASVLCVHRRHDAGWRQSRRHKRNDT
ncbi:DUF3850 domain-containing protein [Enterobacter hormaechei]|nr:DUF3850 domain-containing protein [Enterobacter hormaechei]